MSRETAIGRIKDAGSRRAPLSRERVLDAAVGLVDRGGMEALSMRKLGEVLGVEAMSLYNHFAHKSDLLDGMVDVVYGEIGLPPCDVGWRQAMHQRAVAAREVLSRHPWAIGLMVSRASPGPVTLTHQDAVLGCFRRAGFSVELAAKGSSVLDSYTFGFALRETTSPFRSAQEIAEIAEQRLADTAATYPHLTEFVTQRVLQSGYDPSASFELGLALILDGLEQQFEQSPSRPRTRER